MLRYSDRALSIRPLFYRPYNDITFIVEDTGAENFYTNLLQQLIGEGIRIGRVIGVGGKSQVIQRFESRNGNHEFYIVDGDFDEIRGIATPDNLRFFRLHRYDIESFLVEETAICQVAEEQAPRKNVDQYRSALQFEDWRDQTIDSVLRLVSCFAVCYEYGLTEHCGSPNIERFTKSNEVIPDTETIEDHIHYIKTQQSDISDLEFDNHLNDMLDRIGHLREDRLRWISGKHIFLPLLARILRHETRKQIDKESLSFRLMKHCQLDSLSNLKQRILSIE